MVVALASHDLELAEGKIHKCPTKVLPLPLPCHAINLFMPPLMPPSGPTHDQSDNWPWRHFDTSIKWSTKYLSDNWLWRHFEVQPIRLIMTFWSTTFLLHQKYSTNYRQRNSRPLKYKRNHISKRNNVTSIEKMRCVHPFRIHSSAWEWQVA